MNIVEKRKEERKKNKQTLDQRTAFCRDQISTIKVGCFIVFFSSVMLSLCIRLGRQKHKTKKLASEPSKLIFQSIVKPPLAH